MELPASIPLFPLPDHVLLPGMVTPFRLFEPRYVALAESLEQQLPAARFLSLPRLLSNDHVQPIAALAMVRQLLCHPDGTWLLLVEGVARITLTPFLCATPFRQATLTGISDLPEDFSAITPVIERVHALTLRFRSILGERGALLDPLLAPPASTVLIDQLASLLLGPPDERQKYLEERRMSARALHIRRVLVRLTRSRDEPSLN